MPEHERETPPDAATHTAAPGLLRTDALEYELDSALIATHAAEPRDAAKLLVVAPDAAPAPALSHAGVRALPSLLRPGDLLVLNDTRVLPARFEGVRTDTGGRIEGLYLRDVARPPGASAGGLHWVVMLKMKRPRIGVRLALWHGGSGISSDRSLHSAPEPARRDVWPTVSKSERPIELELIERIEEADAARTGAWVARVIVPDDCAPDLASTLAVLERVGRTPLPPYILAARKAREDAGRDEEDRNSYQTVYASGDAAQARSLAAPTAGLHFTPPLLAALEARGVRTACVTLHVGLGTFKPIETEFVQEHPMHEEWCRVPEETAREIEQTRRDGGRVIAVGTTSVRTLESFESLDDMRRRGPSGIETRLLITPGYRFKFADGLMTNFHLPRSTLMALVAAMLEHTGAAAPNAGVERLKSIYAEAQRERYRFYSLGDAMLLTPR